MTVEPVIRIVAMKDVNAPRAVRGVRPYYGSILAIVNTLSSMNGR